MLVAVTEGAEVVLVEGGGGPHLRVARALGGRPLPCCRCPIGDAVETTLARCCGLDVDVPVPSLEEPERSLVAECLRPLTLEATHHLVEVDPAPAFEQAGVDLDRASLHARAAGAPRGPRGAPGGEQSTMARAARDVTYMCAISCSTRSSLARNGSLQSTVRCA